MKIEQINPAELAPADYNPRQIEEHQAAALRRSLDRWGFVEPIVANKRTGLVVGGHQRLDAALALALPTVPVHWVDLDDSAEKALNIALNKISGAWDEDKLAALLADLEGDGQDLADLGFASEELDELLADYNDAPGIEGDPDEVPEPPAEPITQPGDLWQLGEHRLLCGDSTNAEDVARLMGGEKADMVFTDPPYGVNVVKNGMVGADFGIAKKGAYAEVLGDKTTETACAAIAICEDMKIPAQVYWGGNYYADKLPPSSCWLVWDKRSDSGIVNTFADCELAWTNMTGPARVYRQLWNGMIREGEKDKRVHPTQKPVALAEWAIDQFAKGKAILDLFLGSGSTLIACEKLNKICYAMELSPAYCDVAIARWEAATGLKAELVR